MRGVRAFYERHGGLEKTMGDVCKEEGCATSVCALTASTGLSLVESVLCAAGDADSSSLVGVANCFLSYSWTGTRLVDVIDAMANKMDALERTDGVEWADGDGACPRRGSNTVPAWAVDLFRRAGGHLDDFLRACLQPEDGEQPAAEREDDEALLTELRTGGDACPP